MSTGYGSAKHKRELLADARFLSTRKLLVATIGEDALEQHSLLR